jgi:hypothetical protein
MTVAGTTEAGQQTALDAADAAVRALLALSPAARTNDDAEAQRAWYEASRKASTTVTAAVVGAGVHHRQICTLTGAPGLLVIDLIADADARAEALRDEQHHAERYVELVRLERVRMAQRLCGPLADPRRPKQEVAAMLGVSRPTLDKWLGEDCG